MITLDQLKALRVGADLSRPQVARISDISRDRLRAIELRQVEPWLHEAFILSRILNVDGVYPLIASDKLTTPSKPLPGGVALEAWRSGANIPLGMAIELTHLFDLSDPAQLITLPRREHALHQLWAILGSGERADGLCPWCRAATSRGAPHLATCIPDLLLSAPTGKPMPNTIYMRPATVGRHRSIPARGLVALRERAGLQQRQVAEALNMNVAYLSKLELAKLPLSRAKATLLSAFYKVPFETLYAPPHAPVIPATPTYLDNVGVVR